MAWKNVQYENGKYKTSEGGGGGGSSGASIVDTSNFTVVYDSSKPFGSYGSKINSLFSSKVKDFQSLYNVSNSGWNGSDVAYYDSENQIGAYGGVTSNAKIDVDYAVIQLGRYSGQNKTLNVVIQYLDSSNNWHDIDSVELTTSCSYPINWICVGLTSYDVYGVRWYHRDSPQKDGGNNVTFGGMLLIKGDYQSLFNAPVAPYVGEYIKDNI